MGCEVISPFSARDAARLFSSKRVIEFAGGDFSYLLKVAAHYSSDLNDRFLAADVFDCSYAALSKEYRGEYFFKNTVAERLLLGRHSLNTATVLPEFRVGRSKADCVVLNGSSTCYEIKSDYDNLDRLPEQLIFYRKLFDRVFVVVGKVHLKKVEICCQKDIGIIELTARKNLRIIRDARISTEDIDVPVLMRSLRVHEYTEMASKISNLPLNYPNTEIFAVCEKILRNAPPSEVRQVFNATLKRTRKVERDFVSALPRPLLMAGIGFKLSVSLKRGLLENLTRIFSKDELCTTQSYGVSSSN